jgi:hypothetical protein
MSVEDEASRSAARAATPAGNQSGADQVKASCPHSRWLATQAIVKWAIRHPRHPWRSSLPAIFFVALRRHHVGSPHEPGSHPDASYWLA